MDTLKFLSPLLVVSALADTTLLTGFLKGLAAAGFPATAADLGVLLASALVALWSRVRLSRKLDRKVAEAVAAHVNSSPSSAPVKRKRRGL
jgi:hypothetical protein